MSSVEMNDKHFSVFPNVIDEFADTCFDDDLNNISNESNSMNFDDNICEFDEFEEVFTDHLLMKERLRKTLYANGFNGLEDLPDHPPFVLTGLALELFSKAAPNYGLDILDMDYVASTTEATRVSPCAMIIALIYLERLQLTNSEYLENVSPPGLFVVTMLVASKFLFEDDEDIATNHLWAEALSFDVKELNSLERDFLAAIDWKIFVSPTEYLNLLMKVEQVIALKQSTQRHWLSYSDAYVLVRDPNFQKFWNDCLLNIIKTSIVWTVGYIATAVVLYCAGTALQKTKAPDSQLQRLSSPNSTTDLRTVDFPVEVLEVPEMYTADELANDESISHYLLSAMSAGKTIRTSVFRRKSILYELELHHHRALSGPVFQNLSLPNCTDGIGVRWLNLCQNTKIPVMVR